MIFNLSAFIILQSQTKRHFNFALQTLKGTTFAKVYYTACFWDPLAKILIFVHVIKSYKVSWEGYLGILAALFLIIWDSVNTDFTKALSISNAIIW